MGLHHWRGVAGTDGRFDGRGMGRPTSEAQGLACRRRIQQVRAQTSRLVG